MVSENQNDKLVFWGCFIALVTTAFGFITRAFLINEWGELFGLDQAERGRLFGIGVWPFAVSISGFSLIIDKIGYRMSMIIAFVTYMVWAAMAVSAYFLVQQGESNYDLAYNLIYWGSLVLALGNGTVEAFINPVVATMFTKNKTKWLNILHAGWPGGLVIAGVIVIFMGNLPWGIKVGTIAVPAIVFFIMLLPRKFPVSERVTSGVSYREMLSEFGVLGAIVVAFLVSLQLMDFFTGVPALSVENLDGEMVLATWAKSLFWGIGAIIVIGFGLYTRSLGRPLMFCLVLIMMPLATTELGTDGWISGIMEGVFELTPAEVGEAGGMDSVLVINDKPYGVHPGWVLVYTSAIMMVLRFFAGPIVHALSPLGLLAASCVLAILGLYTLSFTAGMMIFAAATLYGVGKTFFWPTMLGVVAEQTPKGGALTLNAIAGIGMLTVGTLGTAFIGALQEGQQIPAVVESEAAEQVPGLVEDGELMAVVDKSIYQIIPYKAIDDSKIKANIAKMADDPQQVDAEKEQELRKEIKDVQARANQGALAWMAVFPTIMLIAYIALIFYFKSRGGYEAQVLTGHEAKDEEFTGGVEGPVE